MSIPPVPQQVMDYIFNNLTANERVEFDELAATLEFNETWNRTEAELVAWANLLRKTRNYGDDN